MLHCTCCVGDHCGQDSIQYCTLDVRVPGVPVQLWKHSVPISGGGNLELISYSN
jgi:hypothetical protein